MCGSMASMIGTTLVNVVNDDTRRKQRLLTDTYNTKRSILEEERDKSVAKSRSQSAGSGFVVDSGSNKKLVESIYKDEERAQNVLKNTYTENMQSIGNRKNSVFGKVYDPSRLFMNFKF